MESLNRIIDVLEVIYFFLIMGLCCLAVYFFLFIFNSFVTKLLEDLMFFVADVPNSGQDVLEVVINKPNRERQKLMREQNILKQVRERHKVWK